MALRGYQVMTIKLSIPYTNSKTSKEAFKLVNLQIERILKDLSINADINGHSNRNSIDIKGKGFESCFRFTDDCCDIEISLSTLLNTFQSKITQVVEQEIKKIL